MLAPEQGYFGAASRNQGASGRYSIASWFVPEGYDHQRHEVAGAVYLHSAGGDPAPGARLELRVYVNDRLKLEQTIAAQKEAALFAAEVGKLAAGDRVYVAFRPAALGGNWGVLVRLQGGTATCRRRAAPCRLSRRGGGGARLAQPQRVGLRRHSSPMRHSGLLRLGQPRSAIMRIAAPKKSPGRGERVKV